MTQHEAIAEPGLKKKLDHDGNEIEGMNIPMSVGPAMEDIDKKGVPCIIYDIIVNPIVITESTADKTGKYRDFICQLGMQYLEQKYSNELDRRYKLPKLQYMGEKIASQFIQDRKNIPKIEEVSSSNNNSYSGNTSNSSNGRNGNKGLNDKTKAKNVVEAVDKPLSFTSYWLTSLQSSSSLISMSSSPSSSEISKIEGTRNVYHLFHRSFGEIIDVNKYSIEPYTYSLFDYIDPIYTPPPPPTTTTTTTTNNTNTIQTKAIMITVDIPSVDMGDLNNNISISISPYRLNLKIIGYKKYTIYLCCAINPIASYYNICRPFDGCLSQLQLQIVLLVDNRPFETVTDAGSKTWLLAQALSNSNSIGDRDYDGGMSSDNPYESDYGMDSQGKRVINDKSSANVNNRYIDYDDSGDNGIDFDFFSLDDDDDDDIMIVIITMILLFF